VGLVVARSRKELAMKDGTDLLNDLSNLLNRINQAINTLAKNGQRKAEAEMNYRIALADKLLIEREKGTQMSIINDVSRGDRAIARLKFDRDTAEVVYDANIEAINAWKLEARLMEGQIQREWGRSD